MNWDTIATEWGQLKSRLRRLWGKVAKPGESSAKEPTVPPSQGALT